MEGADAIGKRPGNTIYNARQLRLERLQAYFRGKGMSKAIPAPGKRSWRILA